MTRIHRCEGLHNCMQHPRWHVRYVGGPLPWHACAPYSRSPYNDQSRLMATLAAAIDWARAEIEIDRQIAREAGWAA